MAEYPELIDKLVRDYAAVTQAMIQAEAPLRLRRHVTLKVTGTGMSTKATVRAGGPSPIFLHGARAHAIGPRDGGAVVWAGAGHPVESVQHPLIPANDFMTRGRVKARSALEAVLAKSGGGIAEVLLKKSGLAGTIIVKRKDA